MVDWETVRLARLHKRDLDDFDAKAKQQVEADKAEYLKAKQREQHRADLESFAQFCQTRASECEKRGDRDENTWLIAASNARSGNFTHSKVIHPTRGSRNSRGCASLAYEGKVVIHDADV